MQLVLTSSKVIAIGGLIIGGLSAVAGEWGHLVERPQLEPGFGAVAISLVIVTYCYLGWNVAGFIASEIADPQRTLPRIMIGGTSFVAAIYLLLNVVYLSALSMADLAREPIVPVAEKAAAALWGSGSGRVIATILCLSIAGAVSAMTWAGPRVYWAMARDGMISSWLARVDPDTGVPVRAIVFQSLWASVLILSGSFEQLLVYSGLVLALFMALTLSTIFRLRESDIDRAGHYRTPLYPFLPATLVAAAVGLVGYSLIYRPTESLYGGLTVLIGVPVYLFGRKTTR